MVKFFIIELEIWGLNLGYIKIDWYLGIMIKKKKNHYEEDTVSWNFIISIIIIKSLLSFWERDFYVKII